VLTGGPEFEPLAAAGAGAVVLKNSQATMVASKQHRRHRAPLSEGTAPTVSRWHLQSQVQQVSATIAEHARAREALDQALGDQVQASADFQEGIAAFRSKRQPRYE